LSVLQVTKEKIDDITGLPINDLLQKLQSGEVLAVDVVDCYQAAALEINRKLNCVVEPIWEAQVRAMENHFICVGYCDDDSCDVNVTCKK
jgi:hypothetical protein